jgi:hypothetical protein
MSRVVSLAIVSFVLAILVSVFISMLIPINEYEIGRLIIDKFYGELSDETTPPEAKEAMTDIHKKAITAIYILEFGAFLILWLSIFLFLYKIVGGEDTF